MLLKQKSDIIGSLSSFLCLIHCVFAPFLFVTHSRSACCAVNTPFWWTWLDFLFLTISFLAVYKSAKETSKNWVKNAFYISWATLCFIVLNEMLGVVSLPHELIYLPSLSLIILHIYNHKYCKCNGNNCCSAN